MRRREFIAGLGAAAWLAARAQQPVLPVVGVVPYWSADPQNAFWREQFRKGLANPAMSKAGT